MPLGKPTVIDASQKNDVDTAKRNNPGKRLQFKNRCTRCAGKLIFEDTPTGQRVIVGYEDNKGGMPVGQSKCHPVFVPKYSKLINVFGGIVRVALVGGALVASGPPLAGAVVTAQAVGWATGVDTLPGFTNSHEICPNCKKFPGSDGCSFVGKKVDIDGKEFTVSHSPHLDKIVTEPCN